MQLKLKLALIKIRELGWTGSSGADGGYITLQYCEAMVSVEFGYMYGS